ncbi:MULTISPECIES: long-chain-fatty-acid--CoA ligase [unclassified Sporosarcina]|uniref:long-chain-fatty-acid--CoA ligase n=1 Tax=unclassified Sporosarcina TaxID=2647733 RepID=UPI000C16CFBD|nr:MULTISPECIES: long-chain-fatty-acid--CoA ligase [unclassified Sporosarcina]PID05844.1 long-chain fatty acid--CoA ligase [Sporosarcina sp. P30]PID09038.1 long-chain fatty acid--CoA ligase [Sporosarcina sp. P31]PID12335.1 long-chain fatty acid--CoA ligase [Sporosarcina sp. P32b]
MKHTAHFEFWPPRIAKSLTLPETTIYDNLAITAKKYPNKTAYEFYGGSATYGQLLDETEKMAGYLEQECQVKKGDRVLLLMQNSPQFLFSLFAILRLRAVVVAINPMSTTKDLQFFVEDGDIQLAFIGQELYPKLEPLIGTTTLQTVISAAYSDYINEGKALAEIPEEVKAPAKELAKTVSWKSALDAAQTPSVYTGESDDMAMIPYTSGTTGAPKGCIHTNRTVQANTIGSYHWMAMSPDTVVLTSLPLFHVTGLTHSALNPILAGSNTVIMTRWDRDYAMKAIEYFKVSHWINISTMLIDFLANPQLADYDISSLEIVGGGGATLPIAVGEKLRQRTGLDYVEGYGLSETMSHTHFNPPNRPKLQCLGIPAFGVDARIIDPTTGEELGVEEEGELVVNAPQMFKGYYNQEEETKASHMILDGIQFFRTGDIVRMDEEGYFFIVDRVKRMINAAGFKVWPTEVESILYKHPAVQQACVVRSPDEVRGETVKALIILDSEYKGSVTGEEIIEWSKGQMASYKYPRIVEFRDSFPTTSSGKILWRQLQDA